jgi:2-oxoacid:acceptor oxidoreductase gamma subunit (pyruvate/2-ketoisovalerate family)
MPGKKKYIEITWYGRGGQGAITASQLVAEAAYTEGYKGITTAPSFGAERRGAPVAAFLLLSDEPIRIFSQIYDPDIVVVLDPTLLPVLDLPSKYRKDTVVIINSTKNPEQLLMGYINKIGIADITKVALENNLTQSGVAILNTPIIGAFVRVTGLISLASVEKAIMKKFHGDKGAVNMLTAQIVHDITKVYNN